MTFDEARDRFAGFLHFHKGFIIYASVGLSSVFQSSMVGFTILAGAYSSVISALRFIPGPTPGSPGSLSLINQSNAGNSPSWIQLSPHNQSVLYATNEVTDGLLVTFTVGPEGELDLIQEVTSGGDGPANLLALSRSEEVAILNYGSGNGMVYNLESDLVHAVTNPPPPLITFNPFPNAISHPHEALEVGDQLFVTDLGADKLWRLNKTVSRTWEISSYIEQVNGTGPRHMALKSDILYVVDETACLLTSQRIPPDGITTPRFIQLTLTTPAGVNVTDYTAAEIQIPPPIDGSSSELIFVSNRQIAGVEDVRGDPIAIFLAHEDGTFKLIDEVFTGLNNLRGFIFDPSGRYLVAGGNIAGGIKIYERVGDGSKLVEVAATTEVPTASSFVWLPNN